MYLYIISFIIPTETKTTQTTLKTLYSHILLISFMIGAFQPVMPMMHHLMFEGSLTEILTEQTETACTGSGCSIEAETCPCEKQSADGGELLDMDFYPLPLQMGENPLPDGMYAQSDLFCPGDEQTRALHYKTDLPPPRLA